MTSPEAPLPSHHRPSLTCREVLDFLMDYIDGQLAMEQRHEFERHLAVCSSCLNYVNSYKATVTLGRTAMKDPGELVAGTVPEPLIRAIREARLRSAPQS
jgi:anti-sigma factor RsiW